MKERAFSVVELVIVMAVIGILTSVGVISYINLQKQTRDDERRADTDIAMTALENFYEREGHYPSINEFFEIPASTGQDTTKDFKKNNLLLNDSILTNPGDKSAKATNTAQRGRNIFSYRETPTSGARNLVDDIFGTQGWRNYHQSFDPIYYYYIPLTENNNAICVNTYSDYCTKALIIWKAEAKKSADDPGMNAIKSKYGW